METQLNFLFIGNSATYVNDLPGMLATLCGKLGIQITQKQSFCKKLRTRSLWRGSFPGKNDIVNQPFDMKKLVFVSYPGRNWAN